ncbi:MAG: acetyl-CoA carboxylase biotin carboxyl carrier protein subunit [Chloroflexia bacterium]|nr:acetyl-CoA carboxylase biotin carboxyl carrier protein subunit [Chloroflexia bacterium]
MDNSYKVRVNETFEILLNKEQVERFDVVNHNGSNYHILHDSKAFKAELLNKNFFENEYAITINSNLYKVKLSNGLDHLFDKMGFSNKSGKQTNEIKAPIPGVVIDVTIKEGDSIKEGAPLLVLEAMKMENIISSHKDAVVKKIHIEKGNTVEKGKLLIELE